MTAVPFPRTPAPPAEAPELRLPIAAITVDGVAHHQNPAVSELLLCGIPYDTMTASYGSHTATELEPITCEACDQAKWFAVSLLKAGNTQPLDAEAMRWSAGATLAAAYALDGIDQEVPGL